MTRTSRRSARPSNDRTAAPPAGSPEALSGGGPIEGSLAGYRILRRIASGDRADVYLAVAQGLDAEVERPDAAAPARSLVVLRVYGAAAAEQSIAIEIEVMGSDATGSTPALLDVAAFDDGRACLVVERLAGPALTVLLGERTISPGEAVTVLAPIVQAARELERLGYVHTRLSPADILLDERGRPRLAGLGAVRRLADAATAPDRVALLRDGEAALLRLIGDVAAVTKPAGVFAACIELLDASRSRRPFASCTEELEQALFAVSEPAPIAGLAVRHRGPASSARVVGDRVGGTASATAAADPAAAVTRAASLARLASIAQLPDGIAAEVAAMADGASSRALRARVAAFVAPRRRALLVAGAIGGAALVTLLTLVPSAHGTSQVAGGVPTRAAPSPLASGPAAEPPAPPDTASIAARIDPVAAAGELLEVRSSCLAARDVDCLGAVSQPGSPLESADRSAMLHPEPDDGAATQQLDLSTIALVADMGSAVLVEVSYSDAEREPASLLMMRSEAGWRLRELFD